MTYYSGLVWNGDEFAEGYVLVENGTVVETGDGFVKGSAEVGYIMPGLVDGHTHVGDAGLDLKNRRYTLEELVAPPYGLKHRYLESSSDDRIMSDMKDYSKKLVSNGVSRFFDFREGGVRGAEMLRKSSDRAIILGRPVSKSYDGNEMDALLEVADGVGISSISDLPESYVSKIADHVHRKGKRLGIHVSERVREDIEKVISLEPDFVVHMCEASDADMKRCADEGIPVVVCASSNLYFGKIPPIARLNKAGAIMAMGTDNAMLSPPDIFKEARTFRSVAEEQGCDRGVWERALTAGGYKLLLTKSTIRLQTGSDDFVMTGKDICQGITDRRTEE